MSRVARSRRRRGARWLLCVFAIGVGLLHPPAVVGTTGPSRGPGEPRGIAHVSYQEGATGVATALPAECYSTSYGVEMKMYPPISATPSYDTVGLEAQRVWWQPRVWWQDPGGQFVTTPDREFGWHWMWTRSGDNPGGLIAVPVPVCIMGQPCIGGSASIGNVGGSSRAWTSEAGEVHDTFWGATEDLHTDVAKAFVVENQYYWEPNAAQPAFGKYGEIIIVLVGDYRIAESACHLA